MNTPNQFFRHFPDGQLLYPAVSTPDVSSGPDPAPVDPAGGWRIKMCPLAPVWEVWRSRGSCESRATNWDKESSGPHKPMTAETVAPPKPVLFASEDRPRETADRKKGLSPSLAPLAVRCTDAWLTARCALPRFSSSCVRIERGSVRTPNTVVTREKANRENRHSSLHKSREPLTE